MKRPYLGAGIVTTRSDKRYFHPELWSESHYWRCSDDYLIHEYLRYLVLETVLHVWESNLTVEAFQHLCRLRRLPYDGNRFYIDIESIKTAHKVVRVNFKKGTLNGKIQ